MTQGKPAIVWCRKFIQYEARIKRILEDERYYYDEKKAEEPIQFIEKNLKFYMGPKAGEPVIFSWWQKNLIRHLFGVRRKENGRRLFRECYWQLPRGNGKTFLSAAISLYVLMLDGEGNEIYLAANSREQSKNSLFKDVREMAAASPRINKLLGDGIEQHRVYYQKKKSILRSIAKESGSQQGWRPKMVIIDEYHEAKTPELHDTLATSLMKMPETIFVKITSAGDNILSPCYAQYEYAAKLLDGSLENDEFLPFIIEADPELAWDSDEALFQANMNMGISVEESVLRNELRKAKDVPSYRHSYERYYLDRWLGKKEEKWLDVEKWKLCGENFAADELAGRVCYGGLDLSATTDLTCFSLVFPPTNEKDLTRVLCYSFLPAEGLRDKELVDKAPYRQWENEGHLITTAGPVIDHDFVEEFIISLANKFSIKAIAYDGWSAAKIANRLGAEGLEMVVFRQGVASFHFPCTQFERMILGKTLRHNNNPLLTWMISNVEVQRDTNGNMRPVKRMDRNGKGFTNRIDGVVATIMALDCHLRLEGAKQEDSENDDGFSMSKMLQFKRGAFGI